MELIDLLKGVELFDGLSDAQLQSVAEIGKTVEKGKDEVIFSQGDEGEQLYIVCQGQVQVQFDEDERAPGAQVYLGRGQIFGEMALLDRGPRSATMMCTKDGTILHTITRSAFTALCEQNTAIGYIVMRNMAADLSFKLRHRNLSTSL